MRLAPGEPLHVAFAYAPDDVVLVGRLAMNGRAAVFEYEEAFAAAGISINPAWGAPVRTVIPAKDTRAFNGLHGVFADSLPDAWGIELMRRRLAAHKLDYDALTVVDQLALVGSSGSGALVYRPDFAEHATGAIDLDALAEGALELDGTPTEIIEELAAMGGSSGGARPKVNVAIDEHGRLVDGSGDIPPGYTAYIVKFPAKRDRADIGPLEAAYADMARAAGLIVAPTTLIAARSGPGYFATRRFDRAPGNVRIHRISVAAILDAPWDNVVFDYERLITYGGRITNDHSASEDLFRRMVFNVLAVNRDDHVKQHSFLQARDGTWTLAPAYDLTLSSGPGGEHYITVNGLGKNITVDDLLAVARKTSIKEARAREIVAEVRAAIADFPARARTYGVSAATIADVKRETGAFTGAPASAAHGARRR